MNFSPMEVFFSHNTGGLIITVCVKHNLQRLLYDQAFSPNFG